MFLDIWQKKIQEKRKNTPFRKFLLEIASRRPVNLYRYENNISVLPPHERSGKVASLKDYYASYENVMQMNYGEGNFFIEFQRLFVDHIKPPIVRFAQNDNSDYCHCWFGTKNAYLTFVAWNRAENIFYCTQAWDNVTNIYSSSLVFNNSTNVYSSRSISNSYNVFYSQYIYNSSDMWFCSNCIWCKNCIDCNGLENLSYCIDNKQHTKEEYEKKKKSYEIKDYIALHQKAFSYVSKNFVIEDSGWYWLYKCTDVSYGFNAMNFMTGNNIVCSDGWTLWSSHFYDCMDTGTNSNYFYGICYWGENWEHCYMWSYISECNNVYYSYFLEWCSFCLGCIWLKNKQFCIFNQQYSKEERHAKVDEIFSAMEQEGRLGEFFPATMNPFYFNDTAAYLIDPSFTKEEVTKLWYLRRDEPVKVDIPEGVELVKVSELANFESFDASGARYIDSSILNKIIVDEQWNYYRIIKMEYDFLVKHGLPLPRKHWLDRMKENFKISL